MNTNFTFSAPLFLKEIQTPANDLSASQSAARDTFKTKQSQQQSSRHSDVTENKQSSDARTEGKNSVAEKERSFSDYVRDAVTTQRTKDSVSADVSSDGGSHNVEDLRADISKLLEDIAAQVLDTAESGAKGQDAALVLDGSQNDDGEKSPLDTLLSLLSGIINTESEDQGDALLTAEKLENLSDTADLLSLLSDKLDALRALLSSEEFVVTSNLSADELQALKDQLARALDEEEDFNELALLNDILTKTAALVKPGSEVSARKQLIDTDKINQIGHQKSDRYDYRYSLDGRAAAAGQEASSDQNSNQFRDALLSAKTGNNSGAQGAAPSSTQGQTTLAAFLGADSALTFSQSSGLYNYNIALPQNFVAGVTSAASASSLVMQAQSAVQSHPATQTVMASIQKYGTGKENTRIRIQLDPPELGRVEVKMSLNSDNSSKVVLTAEKPETFMMLQRDAHVLEKALQDAGIETDGSSLEFALADEGFDFNQDNKRGGGHDQGGTGSSGSDETGDIQMVEATMDWQVDPRTGRMHYNVLV